MEMEWIGVDTYSVLSRGYEGGGEFWVSVDRILIACWLGGMKGR